MDPDLTAKLERLKELLAARGPVVVGYSGGVDSTLLVHVAREVLGDDAVAVLALGESLAGFDEGWALDQARELGFEVRKVEYSELGSAEWRKNDAHRCAHCKDLMMEHLLEVARELGHSNIALGCVTDDQLDWRPGMQRALDLGAWFPLIEAGFSKSDARRLALARRLPAHSRPSTPCLASRIAYGEELTLEKLQRVDAGERMLRELGLTTCRLRVHGDLARIEVPAEELDLVYQNRAKVVQELLHLGFHFITLDLEGFASGKMNRSLNLDQQDLGVRRTPIERSE